MPDEMNEPTELNLSQDDLVYWLTNGVGEVPEVEHTPFDPEFGGGEATLYVGGCPMLHIPYSDDIGDEGVLGIANAVASAGQTILWYREQMRRIQVAVGRAMAGDREKKILLATLDRVIDLSVEQPPAVTHPSERTDVR